jgi:UDP-N-acetyl-D-mannosaminuronic acid dehydrogenase
MAGSNLEERMAFRRDVVIVGGCGHVGLPLGIALAESGLTVTLYDVDPGKVDSVRAGKMPFDEPGTAEALPEQLETGRLVATTEASEISEAEHVIVVVGTPIDKHLNPDTEAVQAAVESVADHFVDGQLLVLRSTVYPGVTTLVERSLAESHPGLGVAFCPERIAEGHALEELRSLPQIVAANTEENAARAERLFAHLADKIIRLSPEEAELAKLFTNTWRYIKFAAANQLYMIANDFGLDFARIRDAIVFEYPRAADMPGAGFAAGPCLLKDTMQLAAFNNNNFTLGHASMMINEGLPLYLIAKLEDRYDLSQMTVGVLGMAFKGESDDARSSLSYKLKRILRFKAARVLCSDPHVRGDDDLVPEEQVLEQSDLLIIGAPHRRYADVVTELPVVDIWNLRRDGVVV